MKIKTILLALFVAVPALAAGAHAVSDGCPCGDACPCHVFCNC